MSRNRKRVTKSTTNNKEYKCNRSDKIIYREQNYYKYCRQEICWKRFRRKQFKLIENE